MTAPRGPTPSQTVGPFFALGLESGISADLTSGGAVGEPITIEGAVLDGAGHPVTDALLETWQADATGRYADTGAVERAFVGFGRVATDGAGRFRLRTVMPGAVPGPASAMQAPHLAVAIFMRGLLRHLVTRIYFGDTPALDADPVLHLVDPARRRTLLAVRVPGADSTYRWDVRLQGLEETVFFDI